MDIEVWNNIPGHRHYQVSNIGNVKSLERVDTNTRLVPERLLKQTIKRGYHSVTLCEDSKRHHFYTHQLVAMAFLGHKPDRYKLVVDHINNIPTDNRVENIRIVTQRKNCYTHHKGSSKYTGVSYHKQTKKWDARIRISGKSRYLGVFKTELEAHNAYQAKLSSL